MSNRAAVYAFVVLLPSAGCTVGTFVCQTDAQCVDGDRQGVCLGDGACAFEDDSCESGLRYGDHAPTSAGQCAAPSSGTDAGATATSASPTSGTTDGVSTTLALDGTSATTAPPATDGGITTGPGVDADLVVWYRFEPGAGLLDDSSGNGIVAGCDAATCPVEAPDRGIALDGVDDVLLIDDPGLDVEPPFTVTVWARVETPIAPGYRLIAARPVGDGTLASWELGLDDASNWYFAVGNAVGNDFVRQATRAAGQWTFLALRYDGTQMRGWVDGIAAGEIAVPALSYDAHPTMIGGDDDGGGIPTNFWDGRIDDLRVYARGLSDVEILDVMAQR